jgi:hypothetical protein
MLTVRDAAQMLGLSENEKISGFSIPKGSNHGSSIHWAQTSLEEKGLDVNGYLHVGNMCYFAVSEGENPNA